MNDIRKISIGKGHPNDMMHYQVGKQINLGGTYYTISSILLDVELLHKCNKLSYNIYINSATEGSVLWKSIRDTPTVIEYNIDFE